MNKRLEDLFEGQHWCNKYLGVNKSRLIRKAPLRRHRTYVNPEKINVAEALLQLSGKPLMASFLLRPRRGGNVPQLEKPNIIIHNQTTISQLKDYLVVKVAKYDYQIGLQDPITDPTSFTPLYNSVKLDEINPSTSHELILFYQLEDSYKH